MQNHVKIKMVASKRLHEKKMAELWAILRQGVAKNMEKDENHRFKPEQLFLQALMIRTIRTGI